MELANLTDLYINELKDLYSAENQIIKALPQMARAATSPELKSGFEEHLEQTKTHVSRLEQIFQQLGNSPRGKHCKGMEGVLAEGKELIAEQPDPEVLDAGLIAAAQHVEHYEIAGYGAVRTYASALGDTQAAELLGLTLSEEQQTDKKLSKLAESSVNLKAL